MANYRILITLFLLPTILFGQSSLNIEFLDNWHNDALSVNSSEMRYNDCWGFVVDNQEYAMLGSTDGCHFFRITTDDTFEEVDFVPGKYQFSNVVHRDLKIYQNYAYLVCDEGTSSLQVVDLSYLPDSVHLVMENDSTFNRVHNLFIDEANALLYACDITPTLGGTLQPLLPMQVFSLADPLNPALLYTGPGDIPEVHDAYVRDNIAYLNCGFDGLRIYDFSSPSSPIFLQNLNIYQDQGYNHQGWLTPDGTRYIFGDETSGKRLKFCSVDVNHSIAIENVFGSNYQNESVPHNIMLSNNFAYVAYYNEGLRIYDIRGNGAQEIAHYDTHPEEASFNMRGAWGVYSALPSGRILVSDRKFGLFLLKFRSDIFDNTATTSVSIYPNPVSPGEMLTVRVELNNVHRFLVSIYSHDGKRVYFGSALDQTYLEIPIELARGVYTARIEYENYLEEIEIVHQPFVVD